MKPMASDLAPMWRHRMLLCSWHRIFICIAVIGVLSVLQMYVIEIVPVAWMSSNSMLELQSLGVPVDLEEGGGGVQYRGAVWRSHIGRWLLECDASAASVPITERLYSRRCAEECRSNGVCNRELSICRCFHGFSGNSCQDDELFECNNPVVEGWPYGVWRVSICPAFCDKRRSMCFCGEGSAYPYRPVAESCGFVINGIEVDWAKTDFETVYANQSSNIGWCNVKPEDFYNGKVKLKEHCDCKYDCNWGVLCETPTECSCINQCSGNGVCRGGFCQCKPSWFGIDCSIPSLDVPLSEWPDWLRPANFTVPLRSSGQDTTEALVARKRPLIYVYDLPPKYNSQLLEGRHYKFECVNRVYDGQNATFWSEQLEGAEIALLESLLASPHRTMNADEADFFYVPVLGTCAITRADDAPHLSMEKHMGLRGYFSGDMYKSAFMHIRDSYPYWNRSAGRDHIWSFFWDEGACSAPKEIWNSTMLVHWGNTNVKHNHSTTAYFADNWDPIPSEWRGNHPCYDPDKDIVLPAWKTPDPRSIAEKLWTRSRKDREFLFYFNGNLGNAYERGRPEDSYSMGIRQKVAKEFGSSPNKQGKKGRQAAPDVIVTSQRSEDYAGELSRSRFCGVFPGDGWSGRMEDAILHGCIPVIIQDGIFLPYENVLNYESFTVRLLEAQIPEMINILRNISDAEVDSKLAAVQAVWERFIYKDSILLEAERQKEIWNHTSDWAQQYETLPGDDVLSTLMQILHYKLHNHGWRNGETRAWGLAAGCKRH